MILEPPAGDDVEDLEDLFENAPCGYLSATADGRILRANHTFAKWLGYDSALLVGRRFNELLSIAGKIYYETHFAPLLRMQGHFHEVALDLVRADGSRLPVLVNAVERRDEGGGVRFIRITVFNATDRRRYEQELLNATNAAEQISAELRALNAGLETRIEREVAERLAAEHTLRQSQKLDSIGQLTGGIAHDFNNMLAVVLGALNLMRRQLARGNSEVGALIDAASEGANKAAQLTRRLLAFSRAQALQPGPLDANKMIAEMSELLRGALGETVEMETVLAAGLWLGFADKNQLENAIVNLAVNARDAMPAGGKLTVETANAYFDDSYARINAMPAGQYVMIAVSDTGAGMTQEVIAHAFEPFFTTKAIGKGTGLGLSQVFGFVKQSGGHIKIYSEPGAGSTVKVYLPRHIGSAQSAAHSAAATGLALSRPGETILLAEDDEGVRTLTHQMLNELGYNVVAVETGAAALAELERGAKIDLLFTDVVMPGMTGRQLADAAARLRPGLKVLFTTGYTRNAVVHNGVLDPGVHMLQKPATLDELAGKVRATLDSRNAKKADID